MNSSIKIGLAPGSLVYTGDLQEPFSVEKVTYNTDSVEEFTTDHIAEALDAIDTSKVNWINITGLHNIEAIKAIGEHTGINSLVLEDVINIHQLPKAEENGEHLFVTLKMLTFDSNSRIIEREHLSFVLGSHYLLSFQEKKGDAFDSVRKRIKSKSGKIRARGNDYLLYALMDAVIDHYLLVTSELSERIEALEEEVLMSESQTIAQQIIALKKELTGLRKFIVPLQGVIKDIDKMEFELVSKTVSPFFKDLNDHIVQVIEFMHDQREILSGYMDLNIALMSNKMNEIMKALTIVAAIFIPLTFLAGIYGMNFDYMPELHWQWGYPTLVTVMLITGIGLFVYIKRKKWL